MKPTPELDSLDRALVRLIQRAHSRVILHSVLMCVWAVAALATTAWCLIGVALHWAIASAYEKASPVALDHLDEVAFQHHEQLERERRSRTYIDDMRRQVLLGRNPWYRYALAGAVAAAAYIVGAAFLRPGKSKSTFWGKPAGPPR